MIDTKGHLTTSPSVRANVLERVKLDLRWTDWALSKIPMVCAAAALICLSEHQSSPFAVLQFFVFTFVFATASAAFGFLVNDLGDRGIDELHNKRNTFLALGAARGKQLLGLVTLLMAGAGILFLGKLQFVALFVLWIAATAAYSLPPLRLKEQGLIGIIVSTLAQSLLPIFIACAALATQTQTLWFVLPLALSSTICSATLELAHQRYDCEKDRGTDTCTWAVRLDLNRLERFYHAALWMDRLAVGLVISALAIMAYTAPATVVGLVSVAVISGLYLASILAIVLRKNSKLVDPYYGKRTLADRLVHDLIPNLLVPAYLLLSLAFVSPLWMSMLVLFIGWRVLLPRLR
jgi:1,4-dihydroxy-2-naphthoate octaprenyltransferase